MLVCNCLIDFPVIDSLFYAGWYWICIWRGESSLPLPASHSIPTASTLAVPLSPRTQYSDQLKLELNYSQSDLDLVAFMGNLGTYTCFVGGILFDRYCPRPPSRNTMLRFKV